MTLTLGRGPLARDAAPANYTIDGPAHRIQFEAHPRRIRAELAGRTVLDTTRGSLLHETGILPVLYLPFDDLDATLLERSERRTTCPFKGEASYWSVRVGDRVAADAVWAYEDPLPAAPWLAGQAALYWDRMDRWLEEDEVVEQHLRDPYHRADARRSSRPVEVRHAGTPLVRVAEPVLVFETGLPTRAYLPPDGLALERSEKITTCPYKGTTTYYSIRVGDELLRDAAWSYDDPLDGMQAIAGLVAIDHPELEVVIG